MKKILFNSLLLFSIAFIWAGCKDQNYPGGMVSAYLPLYDLRNLYKGSDVTLNMDNMFGSSSVTGIVISDHSGKNLPAGLLVIQEKRRLSLLRGISIPIGDEAANYVPGDSVSVKITGGVLKRVDGILEVTGIPATAVTKIASGLKVLPSRVGSNLIIANPNDYESTFVAIVKAGFDPGIVPEDVYAGDKTLNDGFDDITLHTDAAATFAHTGNLNFNANYYGIIFNKTDNGKLVPQQRIRTLKDVKPLSATPDITPIIITGYMADLEGGDGNYEYMQFMATRNIDFAATPFSVVVTNNAGASVPIGLPSLGWATGSLATTGNARTFKFDLTSGTVQKGNFFYVGGDAKMINGSKSTSLATSNWIRSFNYVTTDGDCFGLKTSGLFANSGNASGFAVFEGTTVGVDSAPIDVIFIGTGGSLFSGAVGYKIANTDFYDKVDVLSDDLTPQPYYRNGTNTLSFAYTVPADQGFFNKLGGEYNAALGKWIKVRHQTSIDLTKTSTLSAIEGISLAIVKDSNGNIVRTDTIPPTKLIN